MGVRLWFDPGHGTATPATDDDPPAGHWTVLRDDDGAVSVLARNANRKVVLIGSGRWSGKGIGKRYAVDEPISDATWARLERALQRVDSKDKLRPSVDAADVGAHSLASPEPEPPPLEATPAERGAIDRGDRRSGWWAFGSVIVAAIGCVIAWKAHTPDDSVSLIIAIVLTVGTLGLTIYLLYGLGTRCPQCKAWYRRETTSTEVTGTSTQTRQESKPVYDSDGKQTGTTYETATYEVTTYRYHYRCKECAHRWTGSGSSERRI